MPKTNRARTRAFEVFDEEGENVDIEKLAKELSIHRSTGYRWLADWKHESAERAIEAAKSNRIALIAMAFDEIWRWPREHRPAVLAAFGRIENLMAVRDPDATPPSDFDPADVLADIALAAQDEDAFSETATAGAMRDNRDPGVA